MCGINGFVVNRKIEEIQLENEVSKMNNLIIHRGPDDSGIYIDSSEKYSLAMAMRRLSIIDVDLGTQPQFSRNKKIIIVFNGEIYNYKKLRNDLEIKGVKFNTNSDTEVILKLYENEGIESFHKLDGMYAFSIFDKSKKKIFLARDYFGEKPLYYTKNSSQFIWASELKSLINRLGVKPSINKEALNIYFRLTYIPSPYSIYEGVHKLEPNHFLEYDLISEKLALHKTAPIELEKKKSKDTFETARKRVKQLVSESVISRSLSDVPVGTFLSGGVDSSIVSLCLAKFSSKKIDTFSVGFEKKVYDETDKARTVATLINSNHHEFVLREKDLENDVEKILLNFDEPFADSSILPSFLVANKTSQHLKVALTGDGGDEVFGGYNKYHAGTLNKKYTKTIPKPLHLLIAKVVNTLVVNKDDYRGRMFAAKKFLNSIDYKGGYYWDIISLGFTSNTLNDYLRTDYQNTNIFEFYKSHSSIQSPKKLVEYREIDKLISLEGDLLVKVDRTSMHNSLECRAPFLNKNLWEYANTLPESYMINGWNKKYILKEAFKSEFPEGFLEKPKSGFGIPVGDWLRGSLKRELLSYIDHFFLEKQGIFKTDNIKKLITGHLNGKDNTFKVWTFYCFQKWYSKVYDSTDF